MAYRGKASRACAMCRSRKIKCDLKSPGCSQCVRSGRKCPGYRDPKDLIFYDESQAFKSKASHVVGRKKTARVSRATDSWTEPPREVSVLMSVEKRFGNHKGSQSIVSTLGDIPSSITTPLEDQAAPFFFSNYVFNEDVPAGHFRCLPLIFSQHHGNSECLTAVLEAIGSAGLARVRMSYELNSKARFKYSLALSTINAALRDPVKAVQDETLTAVILLGLYEIVTCNSQASMLSWHNHIYGAITLVKLRGEKSLKSEIGLNLFLYLRSQIILDCFQIGEPVPDFISQWSIRAETAIPTVHIPWLSETNYLGNILTKICNIRAIQRSKAPVNSLELLAACIKINDILTRWPCNLPSKMDYDVVYCHAGFSEHVWGNEFHVYKDMWSAYLWNSYRSAKILVHEIILDFLKPLARGAATPIDSTNLSTPLSSEDDTHFSHQYHSSTAELRQITLEVLASVPYHLGFRSPTSFVASSFSTESILKPVITPPVALSGLCIIWNLYAAARIETLSTPCRKWATERMEFIGRVMGIQQACTLAAILRKSLVEDPGVSENNSGAWSMRTSLDYDMPKEGADTIAGAVVEKVLDGGMTRLGVGDLDDTE